MNPESEHPEIERAKIEARNAAQRVEDIRQARLSQDERVQNLRKRSEVLAARIAKLQRRDIAKARAGYDAVIVQLLDSAQAEETVTRMQELTHALSSLGQLAEVERLLPSVISAVTKDLAETERL